MARTYGQVKEEMTKLEMRIKVIRSDMAGGMPWLRRKWRQYREERARLTAKLDRLRAKRTNGDREMLQMQLRIEELGEVARAAKEHERIVRMKMLVQKLNKLGASVDNEERIVREGEAHERLSKIQLTSEKYTDAKNLMKALRHEVDAVHRLKRLSEEQFFEVEEKPLLLALQSSHRQFFDTLDNVAGGYDLLDDLNSQLNELRVLARDMGPDGEHVTQRKDAILEEMEQLMSELDPELREQLSGNAT